MSTWYPPLPCREAVSKLTFGQSPATGNPQHLRREIWHYPKAMADIIDESRWCFQAMLCRGKCCRRLWFKQGVYSWHRSLIILVVPVTDPNTNLMHWSWRLLAWRFQMTPKRALRSSEVLKPKIWDQIKYRCSWSLMYWRTSGGNTRRRTSIPLVTSLVDEQIQWENGSSVGKIEKNIYVPICAHRCIWDDKFWGCLVLGKKLPYFGSTLSIR